jgi:hypothetical protein
MLELFKKKESQWSARKEASNGVGLLYNFEKPPWLDKESMTANQLLSKRGGNNF